jgi:hypothetical protein
MPSTFLRKALFHLPFLVIIGALTLWIHHEKAKNLDEPSLESFALSMKAGNELYMKMNEAAWKKINRRAYLYQTIGNESGRKAANSLKTLVDTARHRIELLQAALDARDATLSILRKSSKLPDWAALADRLTAGVNQDSLVSSDIRTRLFGTNVQGPPDWWDALNEKGSKTETKVFLQNQVLNLNSAFYQALCFIQDNRIRDFNDHFTEHVLLMRPVPDIIPKSKGPFNAEALLYAYSTNPDISYAKVNGTTLPVKAGKAHYRTVFTKPGGHTVPVEFAIKNEMTNRVSSYTKWFYLNVLPTCSKINRSEK